MTSIKVTLTLLGRAGDLAGRSRKVYVINLPDEATLRDLLLVVRERISRRLGEGILCKRLVLAIYVNNTQVSSLNTSLKDGDRVIITTPEMGG